jgi:hypothetical protein
MDQTRGPGVPVKKLFKLLAFLGVTQAEVGRTLGMPTPAVNRWAKGERALPRRHLEAFEAFVWGHLRRVNDAYLDAMEAELGEDGCRAYLRASDEHPFVFPEPPPDAPPVVQRWWAFHMRSCQLMDEWDIELQQERHVETVERLIREMAKIALGEGEKLRAMIEGPERRQLIDWFEEGHQRLQALERINARPIAARLRTALHPPRPRSTSRRGPGRTVSAKAERR